jgi:hypothetical protein
MPRCSQREAIIAAIERSVLLRLHFYHRLKARERMDSHLEAELDMQQELLDIKFEVANLIDGIDTANTTQSSDSLSSSDPSSDSSSESAASEILPGMSLLQDAEADDARHLRASFVRYISGVESLAQFIEQSRVLFPHQVSKSSNLPLLFTFKHDDATRFRQNV